MEFQKAESNPASIEAEKNYGKGWSIYMEKGFKTLELIGDLDDKYIYEASKPWKTASFFPYTKELENSSSPGSYCLLWLDAH